MKKISAFLTVCILIFLCGCVKTEPVLNCNYNGPFSFKCGETVYNGILCVTDLNNMDVNFTEPNGVKGFDFVYLNGVISVFADGHKFDYTSSDGYINLFFNGFNALLSRKNECSFLNGMYVYANADSQLYVNEDGTFNRFVINSNTFYFENK